MSIEYAAYLSFTFLGALALSKAFAVKLNFKRLIFSILPVVFLFFIWDSIAAALGWWTFGTAHMLGVFLGNQPLEEVLFFAVIPFFYIVSWEILKRKKKAN